MPTTQAANIRSGKPFLLSQHQFGWPEHRPRLYTVLTLIESCYLSNPGLQCIFELMRSPAISVAQLWCAPKDSHMVYVFVVNGLQSIVQAIPP